MEAKEKAKELYCKYTDALNIRDLQTTANRFAKQCALIAVDEIINNVLVGIDLPSTWGNYWQQVKTEINNL